MKKLIAGVALTVGVVVGTAAPSFAHFCDNANKNPEAGTLELKDSNSQALDSDTAQAINSTATGAWTDASLFGGPAGVTIFARNGLHPAAAVGSADHGIVFAE